MGIREQLNADLKEALRERDDVRKRTIRSVIAAIKTEETNLDASGERITLDEQDIQAVIAKQAKQRRESISEYGRAGRDDLVAEEQAELGILETYLPQQMSRDEIEVEVRKVIDEVGATGPQDMGKVMKPLMNRLKGRADGKVINQIVRGILVE
ncbi:MAG: GatB/YqeY domain-containing protein [Anaerolineae bacterium]|jgi:uncharacterized protein YqeY